MPAFSRNSLNEATYSKLFRRYPALFGVPFVLLIVGASFGMQQFTQTRYDLHAQKVTAVRPPLTLRSSSELVRTSDWYVKEQELGLSQNRRKVDVREEYFKLASAADKDWEPKRIQRPKGLPEWGVPPPEPPADANKP
ncbi:cytochrome c oxidase assembly protein COX16-domain-containing protein [Fomes fomentarius]|nr:cytochrome c oxidase assembly protein COX16-domain-containing protein [Fomes fomentarius]